jgi:hypothetical protein
MKLEMAVFHHGATHRAVAARWDLMLREIALCGTQTLSRVESLLWAWKFVCEHDLSYWLEDRKETWISDAMTKFR